MLMRADHGAIEIVDQPVQGPAAVGLRLERGEHPVPDALLAPAVEPTGDRLPAAQLRRQVPPGCAGPVQPQNRLHDPPVIVGRPARPRFLGRQQGPEPLPLFVSQLFSYHNYSLPLCRHALDPGRPESSPRGLIMALKRIWRSHARYWPISPDFRTLSSILIISDPD